MSLEKGAQDLPCTQEPGGPEEEGKEGAKLGVSARRQREAGSCRWPGWSAGGSSYRTPLRPVTNLNETLHSAGHGKLFAVGWPRLLGHRVLWQPPAFLYHQLLGRGNKGVQDSETRVRTSSRLPPCRPQIPGQRRNKGGCKEPSGPGNRPTSASPMAPGSREDGHAGEMRGAHLQSANRVALRLLRGHGGLHLHGGAPEGKRAQGQS